MAAQLTIIGKLTFERAYHTSAVQRPLHAVANGGAVSTVKRKKCIPDVIFIFMLASSRHFHFKFQKATFFSHPVSRVTN